MIYVGSNVEVILVNYQSIKIEKKIEKMVQVLRLITIFCVLHHKGIEPQLG